jgi:hypothetical protein
VVKAARDAGATSIWTNVLYLRPGTREHFMAHLARDWPELVPQYERLYRGRAYLGKAEVEPVRREVAELRHRFAVAAPPAMVPRPTVIERIRPARQISAGPARHTRVAGPVQLSLESLAPVPIESATNRNRKRSSIVSAA